MGGGVQKRSAKVRVGSSLLEKNIMLLELFGYHSYTTKGEVLLVFSNVIVIVLVKKVF